MSTSRREFIAGAGAACILVNLPVCARENADAEVQALLAEFAEELMVEYPESATSLGIDNKHRAALKARLADRSLAAQRAIAQRVAKRLERLKAIDVATLDAATRIDVDVMRTA